MRRLPRLCRALPFFVIGIGLGGFHSCADGVRKFRRGKEDGTVVTEFALVAPNKLKNKEPTRSIQPRPGLTSRTVNFMIAAIRAGFPANFQHAKNPISASAFYAKRFHFSFLASFGICSFRFSSFCCCCRRSDFKNSAAPSSLQFLRSAMSLLACSGVSFLSVGGEYGFFCIILKYDLHAFSPHDPHFVTRSNCANQPTDFLRNPNAGYLKHCIDKCSRRVRA